MPVQFDAIKKLKDTVAELEGVINTALTNDQVIVTDLSTKLDTAKADVQADSNQLSLISQVSTVLNQLEPDVVVPIA